MEKGKKVWRWIWLPIAFVTAAICATGWLYMAPKIVLTDALQELFSQLEGRFQNDPGRLFLDMLNEDGTYTVDVDLSTQSALSGPVQYDMTVQVDGKQNRIFAQGTAGTQNHGIHLSLYMDGNCAAVASDEVIEGSYYGITYNTFSQDVQSIPLVRAFVGDQIINQWNTSIQAIQDTMNWKFTPCSLPKASDEDIKKLLLGITALPCSQRIVTASVGGEMLPCKELVYSIPAEQLTGTLAHIAEEQSINGATLTAIFRLHQKSLIELSLLLDQERGEHRFVKVTFGKNAAEDPIAIQYELAANGMVKNAILTVDTRNSHDFFEETWTFTDSLAKTTQLRYTWKPSSGTMTLQNKHMKKAASFQLEKRQHSLWLSTEDFGPVFQALIGSDTPAEQLQNAPCTMEIQKGAEILSPSYKNIDQWSFQDFILLLGGIGSVLGIPGMK